jgi:hypothetical protein
MLAEGFLSGEIFSRKPMFRQVGGKIGERSSALRSGLREGRLIY